MAHHRKSSRKTTAAGAVVVREGENGPEVLLVHRLAPDGWVLPHGALDPDEYPAGCAVRRTLEQTAVGIRVQAPLGQVSHTVAHRVEQVAYWRAVAVSAGRHHPTGGADKIAWLPAGEAAQLVTAEERGLIEQAVELPDSVPVLIVRHGKAMLRADWSGRDQARPLTSRGRRQSQRLVALLEAFGVGTLASSTSNRCMKTLQPFAKANRLEVVGWTTLSEEQAEQNLKAVERLTRRLAKDAVESGTPLAICGHRPVLPTMLATFGIPNRALRPGATVIAHLSTLGETLAVEYHEPRA
ncbi:MAG TPA: histidine phosphatase family protein [Propionicimonas sp.]|uniref:histidine phosphatase family protein n=1 Tax=Propionicimonas sp. TaxID=1955623 RepID=UPI002F40A1EA